MDNEEWLIPHLILKLQRGERSSLTEGIQHWDYLYVTDVANAIYLAGVTPSVCGVFNLASGETHTVRSIAERIRDLINPSLPLGFGDVPYRPDQIMHLQGDIRQLKRAIAWSPQVSLDEGLRLTIQWFRENDLRYGK